MRIGSALLDALRVVEIREPGGYEDLFRRRTLTSNYGSILVRLRERCADFLSGEVLSKFGDSSIGDLQLSYVIDRFGTEITFPEAYPLSTCIMTVLEGIFHYQPFGSDIARTGTAGGLLLTQAKPGAQAFTSDGTERVNLWVNTQSLVRCLEGMLGRPLDAPLDFAPVQAWPRGTSESLTRLVRYVVEELTDPYSLFAGGVGVAGFEDLLIRTLLEGTTHNYTESLARAIEHGAAAHGAAGNGVHARERLSAAYGAGHRTGGRVFRSRPRGCFPDRARADSHVGVARSETGSCPGSIHSRRSCPVDRRGGRPPPLQQSWPLHCILSQALRRDAIADTEWAAFE